MSLQPSASTVVCLPGLQGHGAVFDPLARALESDFTVVCLNLPPGGPEGAARVLEAIILERTQGPLHVVTGSYGGLLGLHLNLEAIRSLTLVGTCPTPQSLPWRFEVGARVATAVPRVLQGPLYRKHLRRSLRQDEVPGEVASRILAKAPTPTVLMGRVRGAREERGKISGGVPLMWVQGEQDVQVSWDEALIHEHWPHAVVATVPGGHRPYASHPKELARALRRFWENV